MHKLVYQVFKTLAFAMIFVFVWDIVFYMYRVASLNQRMESLMASMQKVVMENNCLPEDSAEMYKSLLAVIAGDFNGTSYTNAALDTGNSSQNLGDFVAAIGWNFRTDAQDIVTPTITGQRSSFNNITKRFETPKTVNILHTKMGEPGAYGDVTIVQVRVLVVQPFWGFSGTQYSSEEWGRLSPAQNKTVLTYTYYVPCLKYKSVTQ